MKQRKVLLVNPNQIKPAISPIALDYLAQSLEENGYLVDLLDLCFSADYQEAIDNYFRRNSVAAVGITIRNLDDAHYASQTSFLPRIKEITDYLKTRTTAPIILGGVGFSIAPERVLGYCQADFGISGEGEYALPVLIDRFVNNSDYSDIPGLVYRTEDGFKTNPESYLNLTRLPQQGRDLSDNHRYFIEGGQGNIETKRGCDQGCIYCVDPISKGRKIRLRPPEDVADELEIMLSKGINCFHMCDSEFNIPEDHAEEVCVELIKRGLLEKISWYTYASPKPFPERLAFLMKQAGCVGIDFGVDNGNDEMLVRLGRNFRKEDIRKVAALCHKYNITFMFDLLLGGPGETKETVKETLDLMKETKPSRVGVTVGMRVYPGTKIAEIVKEEGPMCKNKNLQGKVKDNGDFLEPVFYLSSEVGPDINSYIKELTNEDKRFLFATKDDLEKNYNYNNNIILVNAIQKGYRGAYWDILRRLDGKHTAEGKPR